MKVEKLVMKRKGSPMTTGDAFDTTQGVVVFTVYHDQFSRVDVAGVRW